MRAQSARPASSQAGVTYLVKRSFISGETQVRPCTPLVTEPMGTSSTGTAAKSCWNISRLVWPWSLRHAVGHAGQAQAHDRHVERRARGLAGEVAEGHQRRRCRRRTRAAQPEKYFSISSAGNRSMPAGTGVWVVKTVPARTASMASANVSPLLVMSWRIRSRPRKPAWPSLVWNTWACSCRGLQRPHPADAEQDLLADPVLGAAAVEAVGDGPQLVVVVVDVGVEQVQLDPADLRHPDLGDQGLAGQVDGDPGPVDGVEGHGVGVEHRVALLLPAVGVELLAEVALPVQQADADERDPQAAGRLQVVAGQDAQAARVLGQGLGDAELGREVGHLAQGRASPVLEPAVALI